MIEKFLSEAKYKEIPSGLLSENEKNRILGLNNRNVFNYKKVKPVILQNNKGNSLTTFM